MSEGQWQVDISGDFGFLKQFEIALQDGATVNRVLGESALPLFQRKFVELSASNKNPLGARSSFWNRMLSGTTVRADAQAAVIWMPREVALRFYGGTIVSKSGKMLTIAARLEAYGKSAREFNDLKPISLIGPGGRKIGALVKKDQTEISFRRKGKGKDRVVTGVKAGEKRGGEVYYWLTPSATITGDANVLPTPEAVRARAIAGLGYYLKTQREKK